MGIDQKGGEREQVSEEELVEQAIEVVRRGDYIVFANDFDGTLDLQVEADPRKSRVNPESAQALKHMKEDGHEVGIISNRGGEQIARLLAEVGLDSATIIGTYGHEVFKEDIAHPERGVAIIHRRFHLHKELIADALSGTRGELFRTLQLPDQIGRQVEVEISTPDGTIVLERKGVCDNFPEGLAQLYHFRQVQADKRKGYITMLTNHYYTWFEQLKQQSPERAQALEQMWGQATYENPETQQYGVMYEPREKLGKAHGLFELLHMIQEKRTDNRRLGMVIVAGDSNADAEAMHAGHRIKSRFQQDAQAQHPIKAFGIWVSSDKDQLAVKQTADLQVHGTAGYARVLSNLSAALISSY